METPATTPVQPEPPKPQRFKAPLVAGVAFGAALLGSNLYFASRTSSLEEQVRSLRAAVKTELIDLQDETRRANLVREQDLSELQKLISNTEVRSQEAAIQAGASARKYSERLAKQVADQQQKQLRNSSEELQQRLTSQIVEVKRAASQIHERMGGIASEMSNARTELASTKTEVEKTFGELRSMRGDLGVQSGKVATNARELAALKALGERSYYEFELPKTRTPQRIGDVAVQLKKWDVKRNRFTIELIADDKKTEKKDRTVNEPVQFYVARARVPYEIVVNEVRRDKIIGYMAAPKGKEQRF